MKFRHARRALTAHALITTALATMPAAPSLADARTGGAAAGKPVQDFGRPGKARLSRDGRTALPPPDAPARVRNAIAAANRITRKPYRYGGGHASFKDSGYDCSGTISFALHGARLLSSPLDSSSFMRWGQAGRGRWITVYTNPGHAYVLIAGLRFDTSGPGEKGPRWRKTAARTSGFTARHPRGF